MKGNKGIRYLVRGGIVLLAILLIVLIGHYVVTANRKYVFIDGGSHFGESVKAFKTTRLYKSYPWMIYAIEADSKFAQKIPRDPDVTVINKAIWTHDGTVNFFPALPGETAGSVYKIRRRNKEEEAIPCMYLGDWLKKNFQRWDYIIVSLDIVGSEYPVLEKMLADGTINYVDRVYIEFHSFDDFLNGMGMTEEQIFQRIRGISAQLIKRKILFDWEAVDTLVADYGVWQGTWRDRL